MSHHLQRIKGLRRKWRALLQGKVIFPRGLPAAMKLTTKAASPA